MDLTPASTVAIVTKPSHRKHNLHWSGQSFLYGKQIQICGITKWIQRIRKNYDLYRRRNCRPSRGRRVVLGRDMSEHVDVTYSVTYLTSLVHPRGGALLSVRQRKNSLCSSNQTASPRSSARVRHNYGDRELFWLKFTVLLQTQPVCNQSLRSTDIVFHNFRSY
eukprot:g62585.t1